MTTFNDDQVLAQGATKCEHCRRTVSTIQVMTATGHRKWFHVDWQRDRWIEHKCHKQNEAA